MADLYSFLINCPSSPPLSISGGTPSQGEGYPCLGEEVSLSGGRGTTSQGRGYPCLGRRGTPVWGYPVQGEGVPHLRGPLIGGYLCPGGTPSSGVTPCPGGYPILGGIPSPGGYHLWGYPIFRGGGTPS